MDTAGQEQYRSLTKYFYKDAPVAILVYDITQKVSFENMKNYWFNQLLEFGCKNIILGVAGNKCDMYNEEEVDENEAKEFAKKIGAFFELTSAKKNTGINELFMKIANKIVDLNNSEDSKEKGESREGTVKLDNKNLNKEKRSGCC